MSEKLTREVWLEVLATQIWDTLLSGDERLTRPSQFLVSTGWPARGAFGKGSKRKLIDLWHPADYGGIAHIFVSPAVQEPAQIAILLYLELIQAGLPPKVKRGKKEWVAVAETLGLTGEGKSWNPSPEVEAKLGVLVEALGPYAHEAIDKLAGEKKPGANRQRKISCESGKHPEKYILRGSSQVIEFGLPDCPICHEPLQAEKEEENAQIQ